MDINKEIKHELTWHAADAGKFEVTIINHQITDLHFCELADGRGDETKCLRSIDYKYLKQVHASLGDLFAHMDNEAKKAGHTFAGE